jgi:hypothetical protein
MANAPLSAIARDAVWLAHRYDPTHDAIHFLRTPREAHARATFLTDQHLAPTERPVVVRRREAIEAARGTAAPLHFIFHAAFCCSTLAARAVDRPGWAMGLKEPVILNDLVGWRRRGGTDPQIRAVLNDALSLLARPFQAGESFVVKPSNVVNGLAMPMMELRPSASALLMYAPLPEFLASIAKKGLDGRIFARDLLLNQLKDGMVPFGFDHDQLFKQTDLQVAGLGWLVQIQLFGQMVKRFGAARVRTTSSDVFLKDPRATTAAMAALFGLAEDAQTLDAVASGPAFTTHSKSGTTFGRSERAGEYAAATSLHKDEIAKVIGWIVAIADQAGVSFDPGAPLIG